jgi:hypothetical protein
MKKILVFFLIIFLSACTPSTNTIQTAIALTEAARPTDTIIPSPTATQTPIPPTSTITPSPTDTPVTPTATPVFEVITPEQVIAAFKAAGLEAENPMPMTPADYGLAPMVATKGIHILIPSMCSDCGGRIFSFANSADREIMADYYNKFARASAALFSWVFEQNNILVQINGDLPQTQAMKYKQVLDSLTPIIPPTETQQPTLANNQTCCKVCSSASKACGDTCISLTKTCTKPAGCACQAK